MPDATIRTTDFLEHDGHTNTLYKVDLVLTKRGETLVFDYSGTSPQAPGFINCTRAGLEGAVTGALLSTFAWDIAWNQGVMSTVEIVAPDGLLCTAQFPAPVGAATIEAIWCTANATNLALGKLLACSNDYRFHAQAIGCGAMATFNLGGVNQYGENFGLHLMDSIAAGSGAFASKDGVNFGGPVNAPAPSIADVERNEQASPLFYFHRRMAQDSAGPGRFRGGASAEVCFTLGVEKAMSLIMTHGQESPNSAGAFGGWPGATVRQSMGRGAAASGRSAKGVWEEFGPKPGLIPMTNSDVFASSWHGGGGWGDPIEREMEAVAEDVRTRIVSRHAADVIYGVLFDDAGQLLRDASMELRRKIRLDRVGGSFDTDPSRIYRGGNLLSLGGTLYLGRDEAGWHVVTPAGYILSTGTTAWRRGALARRLDQPHPAYHIKLHADLMTTLQYCPASGTLLSVDIHRRDEEALDDVILDLDKLTNGPDDFTLAA